MSSLVIGKGFAGFVALDASRGKVEQGRGEAGIQVEKLRRSIRAEVEAEYQRKLEQEKEDLRKLWKKTETAMGSFMEDFEKRAVSQVIRTAVRMAEAIIRSRLPDANMVMDTIQSVLSPISDLQGVRIRLSATDATLLKERLGDSLSSGGMPVELTADGTLSAGDVVVESRNGYFNARLPERMKLLEEQLRERCGHASACDKSS